MPRLARLPFVPFGWYYVALKSVPNRTLLTSEADLSMALKLLRGALRRNGARLHAGYLGEHEVHLALQVSEIPLSRIVGAFQHGYARLFNRLHGENHSLFRLHHPVLLIQHERWLVPLVHFIHSIKRTKVEVAHAGRQCWDSEAVYRGEEKQDWVTTNVALRMLTHGAYNHRVQLEAYRRLSESAPDSHQARALKRGSAEDPRILGDAKFIKEMWQRTGRRTPPRARGERHREEDIRGVVLQVIGQFNALCEERLPPRRAAAFKARVNYENVRSPSRKRPLPMVRALSVTYLIEHKVATPKQAAHFFHCSASPVSARRRRFYMELFRKCFGVQADYFFGSGESGSGT